MRGERLSDQPFELPRIDYGRHNGRPYRYVYGAGSGDWMDRVVKLDVESGETLRWEQDGCYPGEPVFVRRPDGEAEDDGVLLSLVLDAEARRSFLAVLDAAHARGARAGRGAARDHLRLPRAVLPVRASDAERDHAVEALRGHAADGRLDLAELEERVAAALEARTQGELTELTADLPGRQRRRPRRADLQPYLAVMVLLIAIWAVSGAGYFWPVWPMLGWGVPLMLGRRGCSVGSRRHELAHLRPGSA